MSLLTPFSDNEHNNEDNYYSLKLSLIYDIYFINNENKFKCFLSDIKNESVIGLDFECNCEHDVNKILILVVSTLHKCFIIDVNKLYVNYDHYCIAFISDVLCNHNIIKLTFNANNDLNIFIKKFYKRK